MSSNDWDDFASSSPRVIKKDVSRQTERLSPDGGCDWGQNNDGEIATAECQIKDSITSRFISIYEGYLNDKKSLTRQTKNYKTYMKNAQKELREWFENEGHDIKLNVDGASSGQYVCTIDLPIEDQDFTLTSDSHTKKNAAIEEVCLDACRMLDDCQLLYTDQSGGHLSQAEELERKRRITEANKEDDIELDTTGSAKRHCLGASNASHPRSANSSHVGGKVNTFESLMADWTALNMNILQSKAKLANLDLSVRNKHHSTAMKTSGESGDKSRGNSNNSNNGAHVKDGEQGDDSGEIDPLDEYMSSLETKTKLTMDEKIEKSRLKTQIVELERQQAEVAKLLEVARPSSSTKKIHLGGATGKGSGRQ